MPRFVRILLDKRFSRRSRTGVWAPKCLWGVDATRGLLFSWVHSVKQGVLSTWEIYGTHCLKIKGAFYRFDFCSVCGGEEEGNQAGVSVQSLLGAGVVCVPILPFVVESGPVAQVLCLLELHCFQSACIGAPGLASPISVLISCEVRHPEIMSDPFISANPAISSVGIQSIVAERIPEWVILAILHSACGFIALRMLLIGSDSVTSSLKSNQELPITF